VLAAVWTVAALLLTTGALHEDGAADTADGLGGGTRERRLEIMRDSRIGAFGALALLLALFARIAALTLLARPGPVALALIVAGALGRVAMVIVLATLTPARSDGLAAALRPGPTGVSVACAVAGAVTLLLPFRLSLGMLLAAGGCAALMRQLAREKFGGHTGDILGATEVLTECVVLTLLAGGR
jgi:adenosylcobinamide-GDP ribazoletransferase